MTIVRRYAEHLIVDRIVPLVLLVVIPLLAAMYVQNHNNQIARRDQLRASCERGNVVRRSERYVLSYLLRTATEAAESSARPELRLYFKNQIPNLEARRDSLNLVKCNDLIR